MVADNFLEHYGVPRRSGRYPYGSGENPYQRTGGKGSSSEKKSDGTSKEKGSNASSGKGPSGSKEKKGITVNNKTYSEDTVKKAKQLAKEAAKREKALKNPRLLYKNRDKFSDEEIQKALRRFDLEQRLRNVSKDKINSGKVYVDTFLGYADTGIRAYNTFARIYNTKKRSKTLPYVPNAGQDNKKKKKNKDDDD